MKSYNSVEIGDEIIAMSMGKILKTYLVDESTSTARAADGTTIIIDGDNIPFGTNRVKVIQPDAQLKHIGESVEYFVVTDKLKERIKKEKLIDDTTSMLNNLSQYLNKTKYDMTLDYLSEINADVQHVVGKYITI